MINFIFVFFFQFLPDISLVQPVDVHPIHISNCELRFNEGSSTFQVSLKMYIDDLEVAIKNEGYPLLNLGDTKEDIQADEYLHSYIDKYFTIEIDGKKWKSQFVGKEISDDYLAIWCYLEYSGDLVRAQKFVLTNRVLLDLYNDQRNIMDIRMNSTHKAFTILEPGHPSWSYTF